MPANKRPKAFSLWSDKSTVVAFKGVTNDLQVKGPEKLERK